MLIAICRSKTDQERAGRNNPWCDWALRGLADPCRRRSPAASRVVMSRLADCDVSDSLGDGSAGSIAVPVGGDRKRPAGAPSTRVATPIFLRGEQRVGRVGDAHGDRRIRYRHRRRHVRRGQFELQVARGRVPLNGPVDRVKAAVDVEVCAMPSTLVRTIQRSSRELSKRTSTPRYGVTITGPILISASGSVRTSSVPPTSPAVSAASSKVTAPRSPTSASNESSWSSASVAPANWSQPT